MFRANIQNIVGKYLSVTAFQNKWIKDQGIGAGYFYALTYHSILSFFKEHKRLSEALDLKVALIFSWNPTICKVTSARFAQAINDLVALEKSMAKLNAKDILSVDTSEALRELWEPIKKATSRKDSASGVSVTKFLHFSFPRIFPMIDSNTMKKLGGGATVNLEGYSRFLSAWKDLYKQRKASFDQISIAVDMPVARVLDIMIFDPR